MTGEEPKESEIVKAMREEYERRLQDKDAIIKDLIKQGGKPAKKQSIIDEDNEDNDEEVDEDTKKIEEEKKDAEKRKAWRMKYYKEHIH